MFPGGITVMQYNNRATDKKVAFFISNFQQ